MNISYHDYITLQCIFSHDDQNYYVISITTVLLKCAGDVQKVPTHNRFTKFYI